MVASILTVCDWIGKGGRGLAKAGGLACHAKIAGFKNLNK
jgi:hypothetical protein